MNKRPFSFRGISYARKRTFKTLDAAVKAAERDLFEMQDGVTKYMLQPQEITHLYILWNGNAQAARVALLPGRRTAVKKIGLFQYNTVK